jgi:hypothetical protein
MAITIATLFSHLEGNSIVINTSIRDGPSWNCEVPFLVPRIDLLSFFEMKFVGMLEVVSKRFNEAIARFKLQFRDEISYRLHLLRKVRCRGPFLGMRFGAIEALAS